VVSAEALLAFRNGDASDEALVGAMLIAEFVLRVNRFLASD